jgi:hypothetical protein
MATTGSVDVASRPFTRCIAVVALPSDVGALRVVRRLRRCKEETILVSVDQLLLAPEWHHDPLGETRITLGNGTTLSNHNVGALLNRISQVDPPQFIRSELRNRVYAQSEFFSLLLSWLESMGSRVVNRPHPGNIAGTTASALENYLWLSRNGEPVGSAAVSTNARQIRINSRFLGPYRPSDAGQSFSKPQQENLPPVALGGGPALGMTHMESSERSWLTVLGDRVIGEKVSSSLAYRALDIARKRNLSLARLDVVTYEGGVDAIVSIDPYPAIDSPEIVEAVADLLIRRFHEDSA